MCAIAYGILKLTSQFYQDYPKDKYPEILRKNDRPYDVAIMKLYKDKYVCVPFRSDMRHHNGYEFRNYDRNKHIRSGLDFSKLIILEDETYFDCVGGVDEIERKEFYDNIVMIHHQVIQYINTYLHHMTGRKLLNKHTFDRKYKYSTLNYFHNEMQIIHINDFVFKSFIIMNHQLFVNN